MRTSIAFHCVVLSYIVLALHYVALYCIVSLARPEEGVQHQVGVAGKISIRRQTPNQVSGRKTE